MKKHRKLTHSDENGDDELVIGDDRRGQSTTAKEEAYGMFKYEEA